MGERAARRRRSTTAGRHLERLQQNLARLDAERQERERRQQAALTQYAKALARAEQIERTRQVRLAELEAEITRVHEQATQQLAEVEAEQAAALAELHALGRPAEELAALVELPLKRVRRLLKAARQTIPPDNEPAPAHTTEDGELPRSASTSLVSTVPVTAPATESEAPPLPRRTELETPPVQQPWPSQA